MDLTISETVLDSFTDMLRTECSQETLDRLRTELISDRKMGGLVWADKKWFAGPVKRMSQFMESSRDAVDPLTAEDCAHFIVGIAETAALRDAVICSAVARMEPDKYVMIACEPYKAASAQLVCNALDPAFNDAGILRRTRQGMRLVQLMGQWPGLLPEKYRTGVLAVLAYVSWCLRYHWDTRRNAWVMTVPITLQLLWTRLSGGEQCRHGTGKAGITSLQEKHKGSGMGIIVRMVWFITK